MKRPSLSITAALAGAFGLLVLLLVGQGLYAWAMVDVIRSDVEVLATKWVPAVDSTNGINTSIARLRGAQTRHVLTRQEIGMKRAEEEIAANVAGLNENMKAYESLISTQEERDLFSQFKNKLAEYMIQHGQLIDLSKQNLKREASDFLLGPMRSTYDEMDKLADQFRDNNLKGTAASYDNSAARFKEVQTSIFVTLGIAVLMGLGAGIFSFLGISRPIQRSTIVMRKIADGDLSVEIPFIGGKNEIGEMARAVEVFKQNGMKVLEMNTQEAASHAKSADLQSSVSEVVAAAVAGNFSRRITRDYNDADLNRFASSINELVSSVDHGVAETSRVVAALAGGDLTERMRGNFQGVFQELQNNFNATMTTLRSLLAEVRDAIDAINGSTSEMRASANDLSKRTENQAASLEETCAALEEISSTVKNTTGRALEASRMVDEARRSAEQSTTVVEEAVSAMGRIEHASAEITQIINVIDSIAFQTNLLALNAGVEAARAGDAGKGFAVVAHEVRELAQRSAGAAKDIKALVSRSGEEVVSGVRLVTATGNALALIQDHVLKINEYVHSIATAAKEQSTGLAEISAAVHQMDQMTQQNAAMVEETTADTNQLADEVTNLSRLISRFNLGTVGAVPNGSQSDDSTTDPIGTWRADGTRMSA